MYIPHFLFYLSIDVHLGCFCILAFVNNAETNMEIQISLWEPSFNSLDIYPEGGLLDYTVDSFNVLRNVHTVFHSCYTILHSHQQYARIPISLLAYQHLISLFKNNSHLDKCEGYLIKVLSCISLMISNTEHLFSSTICLYS